MDKMNINLEIDDKEYKILEKIRRLKGFKTDAETVRFIIETNVSKELDGKTNLKYMNTEDKFRLLFWLDNKSLELDEKINQRKEIKETKGKVLLLKEIIDEIEKS